MRENALCYTTAFLSNSSSLRPVFLTNSGLLSTSFTELMSTTEFSSTSELGVQRKPLLGYIRLFQGFQLGVQGQSPC